MTTTRNSKTCSCEPDTGNKLMSASETTCCTPSHEAMETRDASVCCDPQVKSPPVSGKRENKRRVDIDFLYIDLSVCVRCQDTESTLNEAIEEVARILETTGAEVALNKIHITSEEQAVALGFLVSPTIRVNGQDIQMNFRESPCESCGTLCECEGGVSCREWEYQGQRYTAPPKGLIIESVLNAVYGGTGEERDEPQKTDETSDNLKRFFSGKRKQEDAEVS